MYLEMCRPKPVLKRLLHLDLSWLAIAHWAWTISWARVLCLLVQLEAAARKLWVVWRWWELHLRPAAESSAQARAQDTILNWRNASAASLDAELLLDAGEDWLATSLDTMDGLSAAEAVDAPELIPKASVVSEQLLLPLTSVTSSQLLVADHESWGALGWWEGALSGHAAEDIESRAEWIAELDHLAGGVDTEVSALAGEVRIANITESSTAAEAVLQPPSIVEHGISVQVLAVWERRLDDLLACAGHGCLLC
jgi:hypothetical protein